MYNVANIRRELRHLSADVLVHFITIEDQSLRRRRRAHELVETQLCRWLAVAKFALADLVYRRELHGLVLGHVCQLLDQHRDLQ
jgi:hypothetical protein